jgi:hypothetical protein
MSKNWLVCAIALLGLSGCATTVVCKVPAPPEPLMRELPPPGSFQDRLDRILVEGSTDSHAKPTK